MSEDLSSNYIIGKVYPKDDCFLATPGKNSVTDNIPRDVLYNLNLGDTPLTDGHPPIDKSVNDTPEIIRGKVLRSDIINGDLWAISALDDSKADMELIQDIKTGKKLGLSLGHQCCEEIDERGNVSSRNFVPDHLGIVREPRRPGCYIYKFHINNKADIKRMGGNDVMSLINKVETLPGERVTMSVAGDSGEEIQFTEFFPQTCDLGEMDVKIDQTTPETTPISEPTTETNIIIDQKESSENEPVTTRHGNNQETKMDIVDTVKKPIVTAEIFIERFLKKTENKKTEHYNIDDKKQITIVPPHYPQQQKLVSGDKMDFLGSAPSPSAPSSSAPTQSFGGQGAAPQNVSQMSSSVSSLGQQATQPLLTPNQPQQLQQNVQKKPAPVTVKGFLEKTVSQPTTTQSSSSFSTNQDTSSESALNVEKGEQQQNLSQTEQVSSDPKKIRIQDIRESFVNMDQSEQMKLVKVLMQQNQESQRLSSEHQRLMNEYKSAQQKLQELEREKSERTKMEEDKLNQEIVDSLANVIGIEQPNPVQEQSRQQQGKTQNGASLFLKKFNISTGTQTMDYDNDDDSMSYQQPGRNVSSSSSQFSSQNAKREAPEQSESGPVDDPNESKRLLAEIVEGLDPSRKRKFHEFMSTYGKQKTQQNAQNSFQKMGQTGLSSGSVNQRTTMEVAGLHEGLAQRHANEIKRARMEEETPFSNFIGSETSLYQRLNEAATSIGNINDRAMELSRQIEQEKIRSGMMTYTSGGMYSNYGGVTSSDANPFQLISTSSSMKK